MWEGIGGLITLAVMILKLWADHSAQIQKEHDDAIQNIKDATASGDVSRINAVINSLRH